MGKGKCAFKKADVARIVEAALQGATRAGVDAEVKYDLEHNTVTVTPIKVIESVESETKNETKGENEWDNIFDGKDTTPIRQ